MVSNNTKKNIIKRLKGNEKLHDSDQGERKLEKKFPDGNYYAKGFE